MANSENTDQPSLAELQFQFAAYLRDPENNAAPDDVEARRMNIYRDLFINNVNSLLSSTFPILLDLLGEKRGKLLMRDFYRFHKSHSPLFPDVPKEFLKYLNDERASNPRGDTEADPGFMYELAHYEWVEAGLVLAEEQPSATGLNPNGDLLANVPAVSSVAWLLSYMWPVHEIGPDFQPDSPADEPYYFVVHRNAAFEVKFVHLNAVSARLLELLNLQSGLTGRAALTQIASELQHPNPVEVVTAGEGILQQWREAGIVLGTVSTGNS